MSHGIAGQRSEVRGQSTKAIVLRLAGCVPALMIAAAAASAQSPIPKPAVETTSRRVQIPTGFRPPAGMCRVWIDRVPAGQQPAPTDCASAIRNRPPNGRVIFSEDTTRKANPKSSGKSEEPKPKKPPE